MITSTNFNLHWIPEKFLHRLMFTHIGADDSTKLHNPISLCDFCTKDVSLSHNQYLHSW